MPDYSDWEFLLDGNVQEFHNLVNEPGTMLFNLYGGVDPWLDCPSDDFWMNTLYCEGITDPDVVWQVGYELLSLFNGASVLYDKNYQKSSIYALFHKKQKVTYAEKKISKDLLGRPTCLPVRLEEELEKAKQSSIKFQLVHLATENKDVNIILKYLDMEAGWASYYNLLEAIETFAKNGLITLAIEKSKRKIFTSTANNFSSSGFDSRHGFNELTKKNNVAQMTVSDGRKFITDVAKKYLELTHFK